MFNSDLRLMPMIPIESEWRYLVNETYIGERCIVPLLQQVLAHPVVAGCRDLREKIEGQIREEINHVRIFHRLVGADKLKGSEYDRHLHSYVSQLGSATLKLFALQGMLEGIALGALEYRLQYWSTAPSQLTDVEVKRDEIGHTTLSYPFFKKLIQEEGLLSADEFRRVGQDMNQIFVNCFSGDVMASYVRQVQDGAECEAKDLESTSAISLFRKQSARIVSANRRQFLDHYQEAAGSV